MKTQLNEVMSLMNRMKLFEANGAPRIQLGRDEFISKMKEQDENGAGRWVSLTYVTVKPVYNTKRNWRTDDVTSALQGYSKEGNESWFDAVNDFNNDTEGKIKKLQMNKAIVVVKRYVLNWPSDKSWKKAYGEYDDALTNLRLKYGLSQKMAMNNNQREDVGGWAQQNQTGNLSKDFNFANVKNTKTTCYTVDEAGHILGEFPESLFKAMTKPFSAPGPEKEAVEKLSPEDLQAYAQAKKELDATFSCKNLLFDRILSIVASVNGVDYYYVNNALKHAITDESYVNPQDMERIALEQLSASVKDVANYDPAIP
jgi:hypothetical protein